MQASMEAILRRLLFSPHSNLEFALAGILAGFAFIIALNKVGGALDLGLAHTSRSLPVLLVGLAVELGVLGFLSTQKLPPWVMPVAAVAVLLVVVVPLVALLLKGGYLTALFPLLISVAAAAVVALLVHTVFNAVGGGGKSVSTGLRHNRDVEKVMQQ